MEFFWVTKWQLYGQKGKNTTNDQFGNHRIFHNNTSWVLLVWLIKQLLVFLLQL
jgi:hypothetical protein